ncbi:MAG: hypothetical protein K2N16_01890, partial [Muribaculaceae bacterium]|nr:hypothetical protein [Muribaculaceae bacterium]
EMLYQLSYCGLSLIDRKVSDFFPIHQAFRPIFFREWKFGGVKNFLEMKRAAVSRIICNFAG